MLLLSVGTGVTHSFDFFLFSASPCAFIIFFSLELELENENLRLKVQELAAALSREKKANKTWTQPVDTLKIHSIN